jgi:hypothetical protein
MTLCKIVWLDTAFNIIHPILFENWLARVARKKVAN